MEFHISDSAIEEMLKHERKDNSQFTELKRCFKCEIYHSDSTSMCNECFEKSTLQRMSFTARFDGLLRKNRVIKN